MNERGVTQLEPTACSSLKALSKQQNERSKNKNRKYHETFIAYDFNWTGETNGPGGLCVEC